MCEFVVAVTGRQKTGKRPFANTLAYDSADFGLRRKSITRHTRCNFTPL